MTSTNTAIGSVIPSKHLPGASGVWHVQLTVQELMDAGLSGQEFMDAQLTVQERMDAGLTVWEHVNDRSTVQGHMDAGLTVQECMIKFLRELHCVTGGYKIILW